MKTVLVTGANGFVGRNLVAALQQFEHIEILRYGTGNTIEQLKEYVTKADFVYHLAGINRPLDPSEFTYGNRDFTESLIRCIQATGRNIPVLLTSSIQSMMDNPYGRSKKDAEDLVFQYGHSSGAKVFVYRLPNVFGKWCRPNYNSVVATFCYNIANNLEIQIHDADTELNLVYIDDVVEEFIQALEGEAYQTGNGFCCVQRTFTSTLGNLSELLYSFKKSRDTLIVQNQAGDFERLLYATYLSYLNELDLSYQLEMKHDNRGWLAEFIKSQHMGQIFISRTKPGITRGNHWHHSKVEKFLVIDGDASIKFRQINSDKEIEYRVSGDELIVVDIPPGYTHSITNTGERDVLTLFWASEIFNSEKADTYFLEV